MGSSEEQQITPFDDEQMGKAMDLTPFAADLAEVDLGVALTRVERRISFIKQSKTLALKITDPGDWKDMGGKPYLQASGCRKLKPIFRIRYLSWEIEPKLAEAVKRMRNNEPVSFLVSGIARCEATGEESCFIGGRSSDDDFFATKYVAGKKQDRPMTEIDVLDVMKAAVSNWEHRVVCGLLGLDELSWDDLSPYGIKAGGRVTYKSTPKPTPPAPEATPPRNDEDDIPIHGDKLTVGEMCQAIRSKLQREESNPNKALQALTRGKLVLLTDLSNATEEQVTWLFEKLFPADEQRD